ncbi:MAG: four helix bundle protein [bacterium]
MAVKDFTELDSYQIAFAAAMRIFEITKSFPKEERYSLTDQIRRSSRSVCANIAESWRKRRYQAAFVSKLNDAETEAAETQVWLDFSYQCQYMNADDYKNLRSEYDRVLGKLTNMIANSGSWLLRVKDDFASYGTVDEGES